MNSVVSIIYTPCIYSVVRTIYRVINNSCYLVDASERDFNLCIFLYTSSILV